MRAAVKGIATQQSISEDRAFAVWYAELAFRCSRDEALEAARFDGGNDRGVDLFYIDDESRRIVIAQAKYFKSSTTAPKPADVALALDVVDALSDASGLRSDGRADLAEAADDLEAARAENYEVHIQIVYPGPARKPLEAQVRSFNRAHATDDVAAELVHLRELEALYSDRVGLAGRVDSGVLNLVGRSAYEQKGAYGRALVATVAGSSLKALYDKHGNSLFDQNVRLFLGARKRTVNAGIRATIDDAKERGSFWAYNNGITVLAETFDWSPRRTTIGLKGFSIVNGCQTTVLIGQSDPASLADLSVLARVVAAPPGTVDKIIRFTNSQTPISVWEMSARDKDQQRLRRELDEMSPPWFYAFRRGEVPDKERYGDPPRILPFPESVQFLAAFRGMPVQAYKDKARLFTAYKKDVLPPGIGPAEVLWAWHVGASVKRLLPDIRRGLAADQEALLILSRGAAFYAVALASIFLRERNGQDFASRVSLSRLQDKAMAQRLDKYARQALVSYVRAMEQRLTSGRDLGLLLRSPDTNADLQRWGREEIVSLTGAPKLLDEAMPLLPEIRASR